MESKSHIVYYKNFAIHYLNGTYTVAGLPRLSYLSMTEAKKEIDKVADDTLFTKLNVCYEPKDDDCSLT